VERIVLDPVEEILGVLFGLFEVLVEGDRVVPAVCVDVEHGVEVWDPLRFVDFDCRAELVLDSVNCIVLVRTILDITLGERAIVFVHELSTDPLRVAEPLRVSVLCDEPVCV